MKTASQIPAPMSWTPKEDEALRRAWKRGLERRQIVELPIFAGRRTVKSIEHRTRLLRGKGPRRGGPRVAWTAAEIAAYEEARRQHMPATAIANLPIFKGRRTLEAISRRSAEQEVALREKARRHGTERKCLCCPRQFLSEGPHNRMCWQCRTSA